MDDLLDQIATFSESHRGEIRSSADWRIDELAETCGLPLPAQYVAFLQTMGEEAGGLLGDLEAFPPIHIADLYRDTSWMPDRRYLFVFGDSSVANEPYFLDIDRQREGDAPVVQFSLDSDPFVTPPAERFVSLREMLYFEAYANLRLPGLPFRADFHLPYDRVGDAAQALDDLEELLPRLGFERLVFPERCRLYDRGDAAVALYRAPQTDPFTLWLGAERPEAFRELTAHFVDGVGLQTVQRMGLSGDG